LLQQKNLRFFSRTNLIKTRCNTLKKKLQILFLTFILSLTTEAQITGEIYDDVGPLPFVKIQLSINNSQTESDFDGIYSLKIPNGGNKTDITFITERISILIKNINLKNLSKLNLGKILIPNYKTISIKEYKELNEIEKKNCKPIYHWAQHIGYTLMEFEFENDLSKKYVIWQCGKTEKHISNFEFDEFNKRITIDWKESNICE